MNKCQWIAVGDQSSRDWVQIGISDQDYPGKSCFENGGYPDWGDDKSLYTFNVQLMPMDRYTIRI